MTMAFRREVLTTELVKMRESGPLTASRYVAEVSDKSHPLHDTLEWDNKKASHEYRLIQARKLIVLVRDTSGTESVPLFIHVPSQDGGEGEYELSRVIVTQPDRLRAARQQVLSHLDGAQRNLDDLDEIVRQFGTPKRGSRSRSVAAKRHIDKARAQVELIA